MASSTTVKNYIDGKFVNCDRYLDSFDPSVGEVWAKVADSSKQDVDLAVEAAVKAFPGWVLSLLQYRAN